MGPSLNPMGSNLQIQGISVGGPCLRRGGYMPSLFSWFLGSARLLTAASAQIRRLGRVWLYASLGWWMWWRWWEGCGRQEGLLPSLYRPLSVLVGVDSL